MKEILKEDLKKVLSTRNMSIDQEIKLYEIELMHNKENPLVSLWKSIINK